MKVNTVVYIIIAIFFLFLGGYIGYKIGIDSLKPKPPTITSIRVDMTEHGKVVSTVYDGATTTVHLDRKGEPQLNGFVALAIPEDYEFQYYDEQWHVYGLYQGKQP